MPQRHVHHGRPAMWCVVWCACCRTPSGRPARTLGTDNTCSAPAAAAVAAGTGFEGYYTLSGSTSTTAVEEVLEELPSIIHNALGLPASYPEDNIRVFITGGSRRRLQAALLTVGFVLLPAPTLPPVAQLETRLNDPQTTLGVASALAIAAPSLGPVIDIGRSNEAGVIQEPPRPVKREQHQLHAS